MSGKSTLLAAWLAICLGQPLWADDKWVTGFPGGLDLQLNQLYKIATEGPSAISQAPKIQEKGTAFAITPTMLITARHVTRNAQEFANLVAGGKIFIPDRVVTYDFARDMTTNVTAGPFNVASVTPTATPTIDAARLNLGHEQTVPFTLSVCPVEEGEQYYLLKFRDGKVHVPRIVPIFADVEAYTDHGEARQFVHNAQPLDTPKPGDSGSPVLNEKGHVVGLLTAIKDTEKTLYVTMTRSFMDLIPSGVNVECADRVNKNQFDMLNSAFSDLQQKSQAERDDIRRNFEAKLDDIQTTFTTKTTAMQAEIDDLIVKNEDLTKRLKRASQAADATIRVLKKIDAEGGFIEMDPKLVDKILEDLRKQRPVIPRVEQMFKDLGKERWSFGMTNEKNDRLRFRAEYERNISRPRYAETLIFCLRPLTEAANEELQDELEDKENIYSAKFFRATDAMGIGQVELECARQTHQLASAAELNRVGLVQSTYPFKEGAYNFDMNGTPPKIEKTPVFKGLYYGFMFVDEGPDTRNITHRFIFDINGEEDSGATKCYVFENDRSRGDTFATFVGADQNQRDSTTQC